MGWSYRNDRSDEVYGSQTGPLTVDGLATTTEAAATASKQGPDPMFYSGDGAIAVRPHKGFITKGSAAALTLAAPTSNGINLLLSSTTAFAHVITATALLNDGLTGAPHNTFTFGGFPGNSVHLVSQGGLWHVIAKN